VEIVAAIGNGRIPELHGGLMSSPLRAGFEVVAPLRPFGVMGLAAEVERRLVVGRRRRAGRRPPRSASHRLDEAMAGTSPAA
jgi:hypothetical protein